MSIHTNYAPRCAYLDCTNRVSYHSKTYTDEKGHSYKWKTCCDKHRTGIGKKAVDEWKMETGCENPACTSTIIGPEQLSIDHVTGSKHVDEYQILCLNCHATKTKLNGDNLTRENNNNKQFDNVFELEG